MRFLHFCLLACLWLVQVAAFESSRELGCPKLTGKLLVNASYDNFRRQHVDPDMTVKKCDSEMKRKKIYCPDNSCKETNTFILASPNKVKSICQGQGNFDKNSQLTSSKEKFKIVVCKLKKSARKPKCQYKGSLLKNKVVVVRCDKGLPVHYDHHSQRIVLHSCNYFLSLLSRTI